MERLESFIFYTLLGFFPFANEILSFSTAFLKTFTSYLVRTVLGSNIAKLFENKQ